MRRGAYSLPQRTLEDEVERFWGEAGMRSMWTGNPVGASLVSPHRDMRAKPGKPQLGTVENDTIDAGVTTRCLAGKHFCPGHEIIAAKLGKLFPNGFLKECLIIYVLSYC